MSETVLFPEPAQEALEAFASAFPGEPIHRGVPGAAWAPGRVNLIGEHTDYNAGSVLPLAVDRTVAFAGRSRSDQHVRILSLHFQEKAEFSLEDLPETFAHIHKRLPGWARYVLAVAAEMVRAGIKLSGFDAVMQGDVPVGGGMSSSAALEVATVQAFQFFSPGSFTIGSVDRTLTPLQVAEICQHAEWEASGVQCGILDQASSCLGRPGHAILLDCGSMTYSYLPFTTPGISIVVIDTNVRRALASSAYNERRQQCEEATRLLREAIFQAEPQRAATEQLQALCDISPLDFARYQTLLPAILRQRAGYVLAENQRVLEVAARLKNNDLAGVGQLLWQGHRGLRDEYEVSCLELDTLVELASTVPGVLGARMMGGGFGGCTVNLVADEAIASLKQLVDEQYPLRTGLQATIDVCHASGGPGLLATT